MQRRNPFQLSLFNYSYCEYFVLLSPDQPTSLTVSQMKVHLSRIIRIPAFNLQSLAHISLMKFIGDSDSTAINRVKASISHLQQFLIQLNGAFVYKHGSNLRSLVLRPVNAAPIQALHSTLSREFKGKKKIDPHITIARNVAAQELDKIDVSEFDCFNAFTCNQVIILKKTANAASYNKLAAIELRKRG